MRTGLKKLLAESMFGNAALNGPDRKKRLRPAVRRPAVSTVMEPHGLSQGL
jgi:hypothetical protein